MDDLIGAQFQAACQQDDRVVAIEDLFNRDDPIAFELIADELVSAIQRHSDAVADLLISVVMDLIQYCRDEDEFGTLEQHLQIARAALQAQTHYYWGQLCPYLLQMWAIPPQEIPDCSLLILTFMHEHDQLTESWWCSILANVANHPQVEQRVQEVWQIRLSPSGACDDDDRELVGDALLALVNKYHIAAEDDSWDSDTRLSNLSKQYVIAIETLLALYPNAAVDHQSKLISAITATRVEQDRLLSWTIHTELFDRSTISRALPDLVSGLREYSKWWVSHITSKAEIQYLYDTEQDIGMLASWTPLPRRQVIGWCTCMVGDRYCYSRDLYLDCDQGQVVRAPWD